MRSLLVGIILALFSTGALATSFQLTNLTTNSGLIFSAPSINSAGLIFVYAETASGASDMFLVDEAGTTTNLTQSRFRTVLGGSINDKGQVAFHADGDVIFFDGNTFQNLTNGSFTIDASGLLGRTVNDSGQVAFGTNVGLIFFDGTQLSDVTAGLGSPGFLNNTPPSLNNRGQIAFAVFVGTPEHTFLFDGTSIINLSNDPGLQIIRTGGFPVINDKGEVLFFARTTISGFESMHLFLFDGSTTTDLTVALGLPTFGQINAVAFNNNDHIAFIAEGDQLWLLANQQLQKITEGISGGFMTMNDSTTIAFVKGNDLFVASPIESIPELVSIDIKPGSYPNCININGNGVIPVAILGSADFDVAQIDVGTLNFAGLAVRVRGNDNPQCSIEDVSGDFTTPEGAPDGFDDLVCQFVDDASAWLADDSADATLTGNLKEEFGGTAFEGTDSICIVP